jgi:hypothetical protein
MATGRHSPTCAAALTLRCVGGEAKLRSRCKGPRSLSDFSDPLETFQVSPTLRVSGRPFRSSPFQGLRSLKDFLSPLETLRVSPDLSGPPV